MAKLQGRNCVLLEPEADFKEIGRAWHETPRARMHSVPASTWKTRKPAVWIPVSPESQEKNGDRGSHFS